MNAYSAIAKEQKKEARKLSDRAPAYWAGMCEGLGAGALLFMPTCYPRASSIDVSVDGAWKAVSFALNQGWTVELKRIGEDTGKIGGAK